jgi:hypothetical protein
MKIGPGDGHRRHLHRRVRRPVLRGLHGPGYLSFWQLLDHLHPCRSRRPDPRPYRPPVATVKRASPPKNGDSVPTAARTSSPPNQGDCKFIGTGYKLHRTGPFRHEAVRREDSNAAKRMQRQQVAVAADDMSGRTAQSQFQELVVFGITARGHCCGHFHQLRFPHQCRQEFQAFVLSQLTVESGSAEDLVQFGQRGKRDERGALLQDSVKRSPWRGPWQQCCADRYVGIHHGPHITRHARDSPESPA